MKRYLIIVCLALYNPVVHAALLAVFNDEDGRTNWQYVANFSSGIFIIALTFTVVRLLISQRQAQRYNRELEGIRSQLEQRVKDRTATLDEANQLLEGEISQHRETSTRLRASEAYINDILHSMPLMLIGLNPQMQVTQWNRRAEEFTGVSAEQALGKDLWKAYPLITVMPEQINQVIDKHETLTIKQSQRGHYHFDIAIYPLKEQIETGVVILIDEVTQRILTENMLIQRDKMSSMGELAATMAYDINAPLQAILQDTKAVLADLEPNGDDSSSQVKLLQDVIVQGEQATAVISNLLEFASSHGGEKNLASITGLIDHTLKLADDVLSVSSGVKFRDIVVQRDYADDLPEIPCYTSEMQQVMLSLFRHSCHAMGEVDRPDHVPTINIQVREFYGNLWVKVHHNGRGLSYEDQQGIFEPFFSDSPADTDYDAGKRLSFSHFIVTEQHHGEMAVTSDVDVGTTFHMQFLLDTSNDQRLEPSTQA
ncbi:MAG: PAS domain S-box-containing protein [Halieaceae bacterium]|jgi:PAS domain S-box-containing protein